MIDARRRILLEMKVAAGLATLAERDEVRSSPIVIGEGLLVTPPFATDAEFDAHFLRNPNPEMNSFSN